MRAIRIHETGGPEKLRVEDIPVPLPLAGEVRVRVEAAGLNFIDTYQRSGLYPVALPFTLGAEVGGVVSAVGAGERRVEVASLGAGAQEPKPSGPLALQERLPRRVLAAVDEVPVVEPRAPPRLLVHVEADGVDDVQPATERRGGAPDVARVVRDLRVKQDDVEQRLRVLHRVHARPHSALELFLRERTLEARSLGAVGLGLSDAQDAPHGADDEPQEIREEDGHHGVVFLA